MVNDEKDKTYLRDLEFIGDEITLDVNLARLEIENTPNKEQNDLREVFGDNPKKMVKYPYGLMITIKIWEE